MAKSPEARKVLAEFESYLAAASVRRGETLSFTPAETAVLGLISAQIDRKSDLKRLYAKAAEDTKVLVKLSAELRLLEASIARLMKQVQVDMPVQQSATSRKATKAANARWNRGGLRAVGS
jgi:thiamine phosphate synthase YjbQ (UPF0047 family)